MTSDGDGRPPADAREFARLVVHELRTPITVAMSHAELLADSGDAFDAQTRAEMARELLAAIQRLSGMIDDLARGASQEG